MTRRRSSRGSVQIDWAGPHGTAWGTVNVFGAVVTGTSLAHVLWHLPALVAGVAGVVGVIAALIIAAVRDTRTGTAVYQVVCLAGAAAWSGVMLSHDHWNWRMFGTGAALLACGAVAAGLVAGLATPPDRDAPVSGDGPARARLAAARDWEARIARCCGGLAVRIENIERWETGHGFTIEGTLPEGGAGIDDLRSSAKKLANDFDLGEGCSIEPHPVPGGTRRKFQIDVSTRNPLAADQAYPTDISRLTINGPIPVGRKQTGELAGLELRSRNVLMMGETGSGKTNGEHVTIAGIVRCEDAIPVVIDLTGAGLARPWLQPWLNGERSRPPLGAVAGTPEEAAALCRAIVRMGYARKTHYQWLMAKVDDDKMPIGYLVDPDHVLPEMVLVVDEIAKITGQRSDWPGLRDLISQIVNELRASGFRVVLAGLRATDDAVVSSIQAMMHTRVGFRVADRSEMAWLMDWSAGLDPDELVEPGWSFNREASGSTPYVTRWMRLKPSGIRAIASAATDPETGWAPDLDLISEAAANGRNPDGTPMPNLAKGDLDWWDRRWDNYSPAAVAAPMPETPALPDPVSDDDVAAVLAAAAESDRALRARIIAAGGADPDADPDDDPEAAEDREEFDRMMAEEGLQPASWSTPAPVESVGDERDRVRARVLEMIEEAGEPGARPRDLVAALADEGTPLHPSTVHSYLTAWRGEGVIGRRGQGRWVRLAQG